MTLNLFDLIYLEDYEKHLARVVAQALYIKKRPDCGQIAPTM
jgi:hypothetical protein